MDRIPILRMGRYLLVTIQVDLYDRLALDLESDLVKAVSANNSTGILIDISAVSIVDSFMGRIIGNIGTMASLLGAETVVVGMQPAVAITLVELGLDLKGVSTALNVEKGMALLDSKTGGASASHQNTNTDDDEIDRSE
ncbi:STAS domain-containing protein [Niabella yanshanensis]|uniref:STAS domain-containing protein n=1 Tax=Niabella yanshanensis TaxID=577386 RepID=A0ABZ0WAS2_9BACT|nr:STAS domain-containing protein [Niabella yanshanensis]WQD39597.1 STAS domain-containing protein [Niabella yanshanensis]